MSKPLFQWSLNVAAIACFAAIVVMFANRAVPEWLMTPDQLQSFKTIFLSIALEAMPFILIGVVVSSFLQVYIPERWIRRWMPKSPAAGLLAGGLLGIVFPLCECGMIPVVRRLVQKGMPLYVGIVYILAGPIINPVVYASTAIAFRTMPEIVWWRMGLAFAVAVTIGFAVYKFARSDPLRGAPSAGGDHAHAHHHAHVHHHEHAHHHAHSDERQGGARSRGRFGDLISHISDEFFDMGKYLLIGCMLTAAFQVFVPRDLVLAIGEGMSSHLFMAAFAYLLSICSTSDAFIASSFVGTFSTGSLLTFLVFGPMQDLKNTIVLLAVFKTRFVAMLSAGLLVLVLVLTIVTEWLFL